MYFIFCMFKYEILYDIDIDIKNDVNRGIINSKESIF